MCHWLSRLLLNISAPVFEINIIVTNLISLQFLFYVSRYRWHHKQGKLTHLDCRSICQMTMTYRCWKHPYFVDTAPALPCVWMWLCKVAHATQEAQNDIITWAGEGAGLFQSDLFVSVDSQLQATAQLLVHLATFAIVGAVRHEAGEVPVAHAVSTHHTLTGQGHHRRRMMSYPSERGELHEPTAIWWQLNTGNL